MRALLVVATIGCGGPNYVRHVESTEPPYKARELVAARAAGAGMTPRLTIGDVDRYAIDIPTADIDGWSAAHLAKGEPATKPHYTRAEVTARAIATKDGSLVELTAPTAELLDKIHGGGTTYRATNGAFSSDPVIWNLTFDAGYAHTPASDVPWRVDATAQLGHSLWSRGGNRALASTRYRLSLFGGIGMAVDHVPRFRPEAGLVFDVQDVLEISTGRKITQSRRKSVALSIAAPMGYERRAVEGSLTLHVPPYGGVFVRGGYEWSELGDGKTVAAGLRFDTIPASLLYAAAIIGVIVLAAKEEDFDWDDLLPDCFRECETPP